MFLEIATTILAGGVAGYAHLKNKGPATSDAAKIQKIFHNAGWVGREGETLRLHRKSRFEGGTEYVYQMPLGFDRRKIEDNRHILEDGLNVKSRYFEFEPAAFLKIKWDKTALKQIRKILTDKKTGRKEVDLSFDGMLRIKVYDQALPERIDWHEGMALPGTWSVPIGIKRDGKILRHDFDASKHLIIAGATGYGKSVVLKLIVTMLMIQNPDDVEFTLIDLKGGASFYRYKDCKQVKNFSREPKEAGDILAHVQREMNERFNKVVDDGFEDVKEAGIKGRHFIVIDEAADLADYPDAMDIITDIARRGRSGGYYLIFCTQYPTAQVIQSQTKRNIIARLSYVVDSGTASNVVLDEGGANDLPDIPGRGIYKNLRCTTIQTPYMSNKQIDQAIKPFINIRPREGNNDEGKRGQTTTDRKHSIIIEKV